MSKLDPRIEAIRAKYDLDASDFWELPQKKGTWIAKHSALEIVAVKAKIEWTKLDIIESDTANGIAVMAVGGKLGDREEWSTGEASPKNNKNAYPWAMAEKRAKDRVVLKLSGIAGLVYSEDEADDFKQPSEPPQKPSAKTVERPNTFNGFLSSITSAQTIKDLVAAWNNINNLRHEIGEQGMADLTAAKNAKKAELEAPTGYVAPNFDAGE